METKKMTSLEKRILALDKALSGKMSIAESLKDPMAIEDLKHIRSFELKS